MAHAYASVMPQRQQDDLDLVSLYTKQTDVVTQRIVFNSSRVALIPGEIWDTACFSHER